MGGTCVPKVFYHNTPMDSIDLINDTLIVFFGFAHMS